VKGRLHLDGYALAVTPADRTRGRWSEDVVA
jgi:hypothetical protein